MKILKTDEKFIKEFLGSTDITFSFVSPFKSGRVYGKDRKTIMVLTPMAYEDDEDLVIGMKKALGCVEYQRGKHKVLVWSSK